MMQIFVTLFCLGMFISMVIVAIAGITYTAKESFETIFNYIDLFLFIVLFNVSSAGAIIQVIRLLNMIFG